MLLLCDEFYGNSHPDITEPGATCNCHLSITGYTGENRFIAFHFSGKGLL